MTDSSAGLRVRDIKRGGMFSKSTLLKDCFSTKEAVTWIMANYSRNFDLPVFCREDALLVLSELLDSNLIVHADPSVTRKEIDDETFFAFPALGSPAKHKEEKKDKKSNEDKYTLHHIIRARDLSKLTRSLTKKQFIENLNTTNTAEQTALHIAIEESFEQAVTILLKAYANHPNKADIHKKDYNQYTPLHASAARGNKQIIISLLRFHGIDINVKNTDMNTPFHCFCQQYPDPLSLKEVFQVFLEKGFTFDTPKTLSFQYNQHKNFLFFFSFFLTCNSKMPQTPN